MADTGTRALCFVDMPFGKKSDLASGTEIDFDQIYQAGIRPAIEEAGLEALRGDEERTGGIIHSAMFARLLLAEVVVADLTLANPNVFYELGIRHTAKPFTTVLIFANVHALPFDVGLVRAIPYQLEKGRLTESGGSALRSELSARLKTAVGAAATDSPLFQLLPQFPGIDLPTSSTEAFRDRLRREEQFRDVLAQALSRASTDERRTALLQIEKELGNLQVVQRGILAELLLSFRAVEAWTEMVSLCERLPAHLQSAIVVRQQWALALNRRGQPGDGDKAVRMLEELVRERGPDPETLGILGRVHKDRYRDGKQKGSILAAAALDDAIAVYRRGFESDPRDYYPGVNAITLLVEKGTPEAMVEVQQLLPLVTFAVERRGGDKSSNYWELATLLELYGVRGDWPAVQRILPRTLAAARQSWMVRSTIGNLELQRAVLVRERKSVTDADAVLTAFRDRVKALDGIAPEPAAVPPEPST